MITSPDFEIETRQLLPKVNPVLREMAGKESGKPQKKPRIFCLVPCLALIKAVYRRIFQGKTVES